MSKRKQTCASFLPLKKHISIPNKSTTKLKSLAKPNRYKNINSSKSVASPNSEELPDLSKPLPFVRCKIVFNFKTDSNDSSADKIQHELDGWKRENDKFVYYESITSKEKSNKKEESETTAATEELTESEIESDDDDLFSLGLLKLISEKEDKHIKEMRKTGCESNHKARNVSEPPKFKILKGNEGRGKYFKSMKTPYGTNPNQSNAITVSKKTAAKNTVNRGKKSLFKCPKCNKTFLLQYDFNRHMFSHTNQKTWKCSVCFKTLSCSTYLKNHFRTHSGERPFECSICSKRFVFQQNLRIHEMIHTGKKPHKCLTCFKEFRTLGNLNIHMRTHIGETPYKCFVCFKRFSFLGSFRSHELIHTGKLSFQCSKCFRAFRYKRDLNKHITFHINNE